MAPAGAASLDGQFVFNLASASTNNGDTWNIVSNSISATYGTNFLVTGFSGAGGNWTNTTNGVDYVFSQSSGNLTVDAVFHGGARSCRVCTTGVEAGLYLTAGTRVTLPSGSVVKAGSLSGGSGMLFRRNSQSGAVEVLHREGEWGELNAALHANE